MPNSRPNIPEKTKRAVRKRCGFGCIYCGMPIFHYDHMVPYSDTHDHAAENLALLCGTHHDMKSRGLLSTEAVKQQNQTPFNLRRNYSPPFKLQQYAREIFIEIGDSDFRAPLELPAGYLSVVNINSQELFSVSQEDSFLKISLRMQDKYGTDLIRVHEGEIELYLESWDIQYRGKRLTMWSSKRDIGLDIEFINDGLKITQGLFLTHTDFLEVTPRKLYHAGGNGATCKGSYTNFRCISILDGGMGVL